MQSHSIQEATLFIDNQILVDAMRVDLHAHILGIGRCGRSSVNCGQSL
jgi:hypothetical protein